MQPYHPVRERDSVQLVWGKMRAHVRWKKKKRKREVFLLVPVEWAPLQSAQCSWSAPLLCPSHCTRWRFPWRWFPFWTWPPRSSHSTGSWTGYQIMLEEETNRWTTLHKNTLRITNSASVKECWFLKRAGKCRSEVVGTFTTCSTHYLGLYVNKNSLCIA